MQLKLQLSEHVETFDEAEELSQTGDFSPKPLLGSVGSIPLLEISDPIAPEADLSRTNTNQ